MNHPKFERVCSGQMIQLQQLRRPTKRSSIMMASILKGPSPVVQKSLSSTMSFHRHCFMCTPTIHLNLYGMLLSQHRSLSMDNKERIDPNHIKDRIPGTAYVHGSQSN